jgi:hypothetical protein
MCFSRHDEFWVNDYSAKKRASNVLHFLATAAAAAVAAPSINFLENRKKW